jgi:transposase
MSHTDVAPGLEALPSADQLPDDLATLKNMIRELLISLQQRDRANEALRQRVDALIHRLYGRRSERYDSSQLLLFADLLAEPATALTPETTPTIEPIPEAQPKRRCRPHGRRRLPENLPRKEQHHELTAAQRVCVGCGGMRSDIGVDRSEQLEYQPASLRVIEHIVHKYACTCCSRPTTASASQDLESVTMSSRSPESVSTDASDARKQSLPTPPSAISVSGPASSPEAVISAAIPPQPIPKGLPGPGLLAHLIVSKYTDHLPLYRLERIYERQGVFLPRSTLCDWLAACGQLLGPLYDLLRTEMLLSQVLHTDDTPVKLQDPATHQLSTARLWAYLGDAAHPYNVFDFTPTRKRDGPRKFLATFRGYLQADAFTGYDCLYLPDPRTATARILEVACHAHARRKFYEARNSDAMRAHLALGYYRQLYTLERAAKDLEPEQRLLMRQDFSAPILDQFHDWLVVQRQEVLPKSPMAEAIGYALNNWEALKRYTEAGFLQIDNNVAEREMKKIALGRKNWLHIGSEQGGRTAAVLFTFTSTCQRLSVEPWAYLSDVLKRLPTATPEQLPALLPDRWQATRLAATSTSSSEPETTPPGDQPAS